MAQNNAIKGGEIFEKDLFKPTIEGANSLLLVIDKLKGGIKELAGEQKNIIKLFEPKDAEGLKQLSTQLNKVKDTTDAYNDALILENKTKIQIERLAQQQAKTSFDQIKLTSLKVDEIRKENTQNEIALAKGIKAIETERRKNSLYLQQRKIRNDLGNEIRNLTLAGDAEAGQIEALRVKFDRVDKSIRKVDESLGRFTDTVGNYPQQLKAMQLELQKLDAGSNEFKKIAKEAGNLKDKINDAKDATKAFASDSKFQQGGNLFGQIKNDLLDLDFGGASDKAKQLASVVKTVTVGEAVQGVKDLGATFLNLGRSLLLNPIFLVGTALAGIAYYVYTIYENYKLANAESEDFNKSVKDTASKVELFERKQQELIIKRGVLNNKYSKERGEQLLRELDYNKTIKDSEQELNNILIGYQKQRGILDKDKNKSFEQFKAENSKTIIEFDIENKANPRRKVDTNGEALSNFRKYVAERENATKDYNEKIKAINGTNALNEEDFTIKLKNDADKKVKNQKETSTKLIDSKKEEYDRLNSLYEQYLTSQKEIATAEAELLRINEGIVSTQNDFDIAQQEKLGLKNRASILANSAQRGMDLADKNRSKNAEIKGSTFSPNVEENDKLISAKLLEQKGLYDNASILLEQDKQAKLDSLNKKAVTDEEKRLEDELNRAKAAAAERKKITDKAIDTARETVDAIGNEIKREGDLRNKAFDDQIAVREKSITRQQELADKGANNSLASEKERLAKDKLAKAEAQKDELRKLNTIAFINEFTALLKTDPKTALPKAILNAGIRKVIQASFIDGTENVGKDAQMQGYKAHNGVDGYHAPMIAFDGNERIINPKHSAMIGTMSNLELATLAYKSQHGRLATNNIVVQDNGKMAINIEKMTNEIVALNKALQGKQGDTINWNEQNQFVVTSVQNGMQKVIKQQQQAPRL